MPIFGGSYSGGAKYPLWYAHYDNNPSFSDFTPFGGWTKPAIKQASPIAPARLAHAACSTTAPPRCAAPQSISTGTLNRAPLCLASSREPARINFRAAACAMDPSAYLQAYGQAQARQGQGQQQLQPTPPGYTMVPVPTAQGWCSFLQLQHRLPRAARARPRVRRVASALIVLEHALSVAIINSVSSGGDKSVPIKRLFCAVRASRHGPRFAPSSRLPQPAMLVVAVLASCAALAAAFSGLFFSRTKLIAGAAQRANEVHVKEYCF